MNKVGEFFKNFLIVILIIVSFISINMYIVLSGAAKLTSKESITNIVKETSIDDLIDEETKSSIYNSFEKVGVSKENADKIIDNETLKETLGEYAGYFIEGIIEDKDLPSIDEGKLTSDLKKVAKDVISENKDVIPEKEQQNIYKAIDDYAPQIAKNINETEEEIKNVLTENGSSIEDSEAVKVMNNIQSLYQKRIFFLVGVFVALAITIVLKLKDLKFMNWLSIEGIIFGVMFIVASLLFAYVWNYIQSDITDVKVMFDLVFNTLRSNYLMAGLICLILGVILLVSKIVIDKKKKTPKGMEG